MEMRRRRSGDDDDVDDMMMLEEMEEGEVWEGDEYEDLGEEIWQIYQHHDDDDDDDHIKIIISKNK